MKKRLVAIVGPTASGKTALAQYIASVFGGEIVNADSRQVYKYLNIGTAKPVHHVLKKFSIFKSQFSINFQFPIYQVGGISHYLFDVVEPNQPFTVSDYKKLAIEVITDIQCRAKLPILVGGTGLYIKAVVDNLQFPRIPPQKKVRVELEKKSEGELYEMLRDIDPLTAQSIDKYNKRRLIRALEVVLISGESFFGKLKKGPKLYETLQIALDVPKETLFQNIEKRTHQMINRGLEDEVKNLVKKYGWTNVLLNTIGYKEWKEYFEREKSKKEVISEIIKNTKLLVKKQLTWFRAQKDIHWVKDKKEAEQLVKNFLL